LPQGAHVEQMRDLGPYPLEKPKYEFHG